MLPMKIYFKSKVTKTKQKIPEEFASVRKEILMVSFRQKESDPRWKL